MTYTQNIDLPTARVGDAYLGFGGFAGILIRPAVEEGETATPVAPSDPLTRVRMQFRRGCQVFALDTDPAANPDHLMTITDAAAWVVESTIIKDFLPLFGNWEWDAEFFSAYFGGGSCTLFSGVLMVDRQVSR